MRYELYRPIGESWFKEGFWKIAEPYKNDPGTILQYLGIRDETYIPLDATRPLNDIKERHEGYYIIKGINKDHHAVTLDQFKNINFDIIIASYLPHYQTFTELRDKYQPQAKIICQAGNNWLANIDWRVCKNLMASCAPDPSVPDSVNKVYYHQRFDTDIYSFVPLKTQPRTIRSFLNTFDSSDLFKEDFELFLQLENLMPDYKFESYGASCRDGVILGDEKISTLMRESIPLNFKKGGDGFGYCIHQYFAVGRAPIVKMDYYKNQMAGELMQDQVTCITVDNLSLVEMAKKIKYFTRYSEYKNLCRNAYNRFKKVVDFDKEQKEIETFLANLI